jgi:hypothetical protein
MLSNKVRNALVTLVAAVSLGSALIAPAASQAQWHTIVFNGHVFTHSNWTEGGQSPCDRISGELGKAKGALGQSPDAEGEVVRTEGEAFEYGCDLPGKEVGKTAVKSGGGAKAGAAKAAAAQKSARGLH